MTRRTTLFLSILTLVFGGLIVFNVGKKILLGYFFSHYQPPALSVASAKVSATDWHPTVHAVGNFKAINGVNVTSQAAGSVMAIHFKSGEHVVINQPLVDLDDTVDQATLKFNQADLALQKVNYQRQLELLKTNATSTSNADEARAKLLEAEANIEKTQALLDEKHIKAPFTGRLGLSEINLGEYIVPGQTSIVTLQSLDCLFIDFYLAEQNLNQLQLGQTVTASLPSYPDLLFVGKITAINSKADTDTHNIKIQATFSNCSRAALADLKHSALIKTIPVNNTTQTRVYCDSAKNLAQGITDYAFVPGMFASVEIEQPTISNVLVVPSTAISYSLYGNSVFLIEASSPNASSAEKTELFVKQVFVTTGEQAGNQTIITKGLKKDQLVVGAGELKLQNGTRVVINNEIPLINNHSPEQLSE